MKVRMTKDGFTIENKGTVKQFSKEDLKTLRAGIVFEQTVTKCSTDEAQLRSATKLFNREEK